CSSDLAVPAAVAQLDRVVHDARPVRLALSAQRRERADRREVGQALDRERAAHAAPHGERPDGGVEHVRGGTIPGVDPGRHRERVERVLERGVGRADLDLRHRGGGGRLRGEPRREQRRHALRREGEGVGRGEVLTLLTPVLARPRALDVERAERLERRAIAPVRHAQVPQARRRAPVARAEEPGPRRAEDVVDVRPRARRPRDDRGRCGHRAPTSESWAAAASCGAADALAAAGRGTRYSASTSPATTRSTSASTTSPVLTPARYWSAVAVTETPAAIATAARTGVPSVKATCCVIAVRPVARPCSSSGRPDVTATV